MTLGYTVKGFTLTHLSNLEAMLEGVDAATKSTQKRRGVLRRGDAGNLRGREKGLSPTDNSAKNEYNTLGALSLKVYLLIY